MKRITALLVSLILILGLIPTGFAVGTVKGEAVVSVELSGSEDFAAFLRSGESAEELMVLEDDGAVYRALMLVTSSCRDSETLVRELPYLPEVAYAEPNYSYETADSDQTNYQYAFLGKYYGMDVPGWNQSENRNAAGTVVAVLDTGVDYGHPDLQDVMWDDGLKYKALTDMGGGKYGLNACNGYDSTDPMDDQLHGTHCAGIIAGVWNEYGISGAANGVKIMAVKAADSRGNFYSEAVLRGCSYILKAKEAGVNVAVVNNSWSSAGISAALDDAVTKLGEAGIVSVFASGNSAADCDTMLQTASTLKTNPYAVVVNASDDNGNLVWFSNYGRCTTDVAAPGYNIYSTVPRSLGLIDPESVKPALTAQFGENGSNFEISFPEDDISAKSSTETSDRIEIYYNGKFGMENALRSSYSIEATFTPKEEVWEEYGESFAKSEYLSLYTHLSAEGDPQKTAILSSLWAWGMAESDTEPKLYEMTSGFFTSEGSALKIRLKDTFFAVGADGKDILVHPVFRDYEEYPDMKYRELTFCGIVLQIDGEELKPASEQKMILENLCIVTAEPIPYAYESGTSMACPAVAGEAAILAAAFPNDSAAKIAARIVGSVSRPNDKIGGNPDARLITADTCVSGGIASVRKALAGDTVPVLNSAEIEDGVLTIEGFFFGNKRGTVNVDDVKCTVLDWSAEQVKIAVPNGFRAGEKKIEITTAEKKSGHQYFVLETAKRFEKLEPLFPDSRNGRGFLPDSLYEIGGKIYCLTRDLLEGSPNFEIWQYDDTRWIKCQSPVGISRMLTADPCVYSGKLVLIAENRAQEACLWSYDPTTDYWDTPQKITKGAEIAKNSSVCPIGDTLAVITPDGAVFELDAETLTLTDTGAYSKDEKPVRRKNVQIVSAGADGFQIIFGSDPEGNLSGDVVQVTVQKDSEGNHWKAERLADRRLIHIVNGKAYLGAYEIVSLEDEIQAASVPGGAIITGPVCRGTNGNLYDVFRYFASDGSITALDTRISAGTYLYHTAGCFADGNLYVIADSLDETGTRIFGRTFIGSSQYRDVADSVWYAASVEEITARGLMNGTGNGCFSPNASASRAMIATILWRMAGEPDSGYEITFDDTVRDAWYTDAVCWAAESGIVTGYSDKLFGTNDPITREQLSTMLYRYAKPEDWEAGEMLGSQFSDTEQISAYARESVAWCVENGILNGSDGTLNPKAKATRAQTAAMLERFAEYAMQ